MKQSAAKQTLKITAVNGIVRALGMLLRILLSRLLGAEIMGIAELSQSVHMLAITPLTSGLPLAVSRMTAKARPEDRTKPLLAGLWLVRIATLVLMPLMLFFSPQLARLTGDVRVLPSLWCSAPCILILGYSAVYNRLPVRGGTQPAARVVGAGGAAAPADDLRRAFVGAAPSGGPVGGGGAGLFHHGR